MKKVGFLTLAAGIAVISVLATCHAVSKEDAGLLGGPAAAQPLSLASIAPDSSEGCCLLAAHDVPASFLAATAERDNGRYLMGAAIAFLSLRRLMGREQGTHRRVPFSRERNSFVFRYLQEAFARGIIQPRIFEVAIV